MASSPMTRPTLEQLEVELVRRKGLHRYIKLAWPNIEAVEFIDGWHLEELAIHLEAVSRGEITRLIVNVPPGCMKSLSVSVLWPSFDWQSNGADKFMFASFDLSLSERDAMRTKALVRSEWFQRRWGLQANPSLLADNGLKPYTIAADGEKQDTAKIYWTTEGGFRFSTSTKGKATGWHAHKQVIDDPTNPTLIKGGGKAARAELKRTDDWYSGTMSTRKADPQNFARVIIMQRLHSNDLCGLMEKTGDYTVLKLPMNRGKVRCVTGWTAADGTPRVGGDRRTEVGEPLWPERFNDEAIAITRKELGPANAAAQLDQTPTAEGGAIIKMVWCQRRYKTVPANATWLQFWDLSFDDAEEASYNAGQCWAFTKSEAFLVDRIKERLDFPGQLATTKFFKIKHPKVRHVIVEKKANGSALLKTMAKDVPGFIAWDPGNDSKEGRMHAVSGYFEAGNVLFPENPTFDLAEYLSEITTFPKAPNDDEADCTSMALTRIFGKATNRLAAAMDNLKL